MGVERLIRFRPGTAPGWPEIAAKLVAAGEQPVLRMIDGLPAFPDEVPDPGWREVRVGLSGGMVTIRRAGDEVRCVTWGTADTTLQDALDRCSRAVAAAGDGTVVAPG